jgi:hypothetical protein
VIKMILIELLLILVALGVVLYFIRKRAHKHIWIYTISAKDNSYNMFYCSGCMRYAKAVFDDNGKIVVRIYEIKKPWRKK